MVGLQMREPHLDALSLVSRSGECLCLHLSPTSRASSCRSRGIPPKLVQAINNIKNNSVAGVSLASLYH
jgi:hypothetical protein